MEIHQTFQSQFQVPMKENSGSPAQGYRKRRKKQTGRGTKGIETSVTCSCRIGIEGREVEVLIDTGSSVTLARESAVEQASIKETRPPRSCLKSATGHEIQVIHEAKLAYEVGGE